MSLKPMRAAAVSDLTALRFPMVASPKYDGIRAIWMPGQGLVSNNLKPIPNELLQAALSVRVSHPVPLDMELLAAANPYSFQAATSAVMSGHGEAPILAMVFDSVTDELFATRWQIAQRVTETLHRAVRGIGLTLELAPQREVGSINELLAYEAELLAEGYEGVMLRDPDSRYKFGRSTLREASLLKLKRFEDSEAVVLGVYEQMHNANAATRNAVGKIERSSAKAGKVGKGVAGGLNVRDLKTGVEFDVGTGFNDAQRAEIYAAPEQFIGQIIKYKFLPVGVKDKPRHPVFLGFRHINDIAR